MCKSAKTYCIAAIAILSSSAFGQFSGTFELSPAGCQAKGECKLSFDLQYKDPKGVVWQADAKDKTDGASIPPWAQPFVGNPFDPQFVKAAAIHDHYCVRQVRPWRQTHRVFYDALLEQGVDTAKAKLMYYAVYLGGPKWVKLVPGKNCGGGCLNSIGTLKSGMQSRPADFNRPGFAEDLKEVEKLLSTPGASLSLGDLEKRAQSKRPNDLFYRHADFIVTNIGLQTE